MKKSKNPKLKKAKVQVHNNTVYHYNTCASCNEDFIFQHYTKNKKGLEATFLSLVLKAKTDPLCPDCEALAKKKQVIQYILTLTQQEHKDLLDELKTFTLTGDIECK